MGKAPLNIKPSKPLVSRIVLLNKFFPPCICLVLSLLFIIIVPGPSFAEFEIHSFGTARAVGEGGAYTAVTDNVNSVFYNPAAVEFGNGQNYSIGYKQDISGATGYALGFTQKLTESDLIGFGIDNTDSSGGSNGLMALSYARKLNDTYTLGLSAKRLYITSPSFSGDSLSGNFGLIYALNKNVSLGLAIDNFVKTNFKTGVNSEEVVLTAFSLGVSYVSDGPLLERIDVNYKFSRDEHFAGLGFGAGISARLFGLKIWKGYSYLNEDVVPASYYNDYFHFPRTAAWEEAIGVSIPISNNLMIEWSIATNDLNVFSLIYKNQ